MFLDVSWVAWVKFWVIAILGFWVASTVIYYLVLSPEAKKDFNDKFGDPFSVPLTLWGWLVEAGSVIRKVWLGWSASPPPEAATPPLVNAEVVKDVPISKPMEFAELRAATNALRAEEKKSSAEYLSDLAQLSGNVQFLVVTPELDAARLARLIILVDKIAGLRGYDMDSEVRKALGK